MLGEGRRNPSEEGLSPPFPQAPIPPLPKIFVFIESLLSDSGEVGGIFPYILLSDSGEAAVSGDAWEGPLHPGFFCSGVAEFSRIGEGEIPQAALGWGTSGVLFPHTLLCSDETGGIFL